MRLDDIRYWIYFAAFLPDSFVTLQDSADFDLLKKKKGHSCMRKKQLHGDFFLKDPGW